MSVRLEKTTIMAETLSSSWHFVLIYKNKTEIQYKNEDVVYWMALV